ncbi:hypothetical protein NDI44_00640 [Trichocoleus sp. DQ-A3]|uniref:hypothetical protein n=1 Tax=Coleofasciculus sp. FACHB-125 TaxID=2692784 RepID=UPI0016851EDC|nr:hypothetical protein [Coleofasciculus sp. FACHB-125]
MKIAKRGVSLAPKKSICFVDAFYSSRPLLREQLGRSDRVPNSAVWFRKLATGTGFRGSDC